MILHGQMADKTPKKVIIYISSMLDLFPLIQKGIVSLDYMQLFLKTLKGAIFNFIPFAFTRIRNSKQIIKYNYEIEKQHAINKERERIARDIHDDIGSGLSAIQLLSNYLKENTKDQYPEFSAEFNKILQASADLNQRIREIIWTINIKDDSVNSLILFIRKYLNDLQESVKNEIQVFSPDIFPEIILSGDHRKQIFLCVKEAVNNSLKHSKSNHIDVYINIDNKNNTTITIQDDGIGFDANNFNLNAIGNGNGISNIIMRMAEINGTTEIHSDNNGTQLTLRFQA
ncbi:MAG: histidine kinase [Bacteroidota bacterium]|nr:histidine kinase [Bacteroidota bacterium]